MDFVTRGGCGETAVIGGDDAFAAKHARETEDAFGDQLGVLHKRNAVGYDPGIRTLSSGRSTSSQTRHSCSCRGLAASIEYAPARICSIRSTKCFKSRSLTRGATLVL